MNFNVEDEESIKELAVETPFSVLDIKDTIRYLRQQGEVVNGTVKFDVIYRNLPQGTHIPRAWNEEEKYILIIIFHNGEKIETKATETELNRLYEIFLDSEKEDFCIIGNDVIDVSEVEQFRYKEIQEGGLENETTQSVVCRGNVES